MIYFFLVILCVAFIELFILLDVTGKVKSVLNVSREAAAVLMSSDMSDDEKEAIIRRSSLDLFKATFSFTLKFAIIFLVLYGLYEAFVYVFPESGQALYESMFSWIVILALTAVGMGYVWVRNKVLK